VMSWAEAMNSALYGPDGFYRTQQPASHFRTSVGASAAFAEAIALLARRVDESLRHPDRFDLVDVGAGDGRLLAQVLAHLPPDLQARSCATAVDLRARPPLLPEVIDWTSELSPSITGLVIANEWLDNLGCDVVQVDGGQLLQVLVEPGTGNELLGEPATHAQRAWLADWWPELSEGDRCEVGLRRDEAWGGVVRRLTEGVALAVDYGHQIDERASGVFSGGTLAGYRHGRQVPPLPDGTCDITAHVAMDACAAAGRRAGAESTAMLRQRDALDALGLQRTAPPRELAHQDPAGYVRALSRVGEIAELRDAGSLGSFWWLLQTKGCVLGLT
jgi:SAM-dependent MidA family methyltransferase